MRREGQSEEEGREGGRWAGAEEESLQRMRMTQKRIEGRKRKLVGMASC